MKKKYILALLLTLFLVSQPSKTISPEKFGDCINLTITIMPYVAAMVTYLQRQKAKESGMSEEKIEEQYPYKLVGFGPYGISMISYLTTMFITQKYCWQKGKIVLAPITPHSFPVYAILGALVGSTSMVSGLIGSKIITNLLRFK